MRVIHSFQLKNFRYLKHNRRDEVGSEIVSGLNSLPTIGEGFVGRLHWKPETVAVVYYIAADEQV